MKRKIKRETIKRYYGEYMDGEYHIKRIFSSTTNDYDADGILLSSVEHNYYENGDVSYINVTSRSVDGDYFVYKTEGWRPNGFSIEKRDKQGRILESNPYGVCYRCSYDEQGRVEKEGNDGLWEDTYERDENGVVIKSHHKRSDEEPYTTTHYYSRDFMGNIVETAINEKGKHVESRIHDGVTKSIIEIKEIGDIDERGSTIKTLTADGRETCGMYCDNELLNHYNLCYCEYDNVGNWIIQMTPRFLNVPQYYMKQSGWPQDYCIEIRDIEYVDLESSYESLSEFSSFNDF
jgi:hypothetical protein